MKSSMERFLEKVNKTDTCWLWAGSLPQGKYGRFWFNKKVQDAHRVSYELFKGTISNDLYVCHTCDNKSCVNPDHLFLGTQQDNMRDMVNKGKSRVGEKHELSKLVENEVKEIRQKFINGYRKIDLAKQYNVGWECIHKIVLRQRWKHI